MRRLLCFIGVHRWRLHAVLAPTFVEAVRQAGVGDTYVHQSRRGFRAYYHKCECGQRRFSTYGDWLECIGEAE